MIGDYNIEYRQHSGIFCKKFGAELETFKITFLGKGDTELYTACKCANNRREYERKLSQNVEG